MNGRDEGRFDRYRQGQMSRQEREEFLRRAESDAELEKHLRADAAIDGAIYKDRLAAPADHANARARALTMLAATPAVSSATAVGAKSWLASLFSSAATLPGIAAAALVTAVTVYVALPSSTPAPTPQPIARAADSVEPKQQIMLAPVVIDSAHVVSIGEQPSVVDTLRVETPVQSTAREQVPVEPARPVNEQLKQEAPRPIAVAHDTATHAPRETRKPKTYASDSVRMKVTIEAPEVR